MVKNMIKKIITKLAVVFSIILISYGVSASTKDMKINEVFKNERFAKAIADKLSKNPQDLVTQDELDGITGATMVTGTSKLDSLEGIGYLTNLKGLVVDGSSVSEVPEEITKLKNLTELQINGSKLTSLPNNLNDLTKLTKISFKNNQINTLPDSLSNLKELNDVDMSGNTLKEINTTFSNAKKINLAKNQLTNISDSIATIPTLEYLDLRQNHLTSLNMKLDDLTNIKELYVSENKITEKVPNVIFKEGKISKFNMDNHTQAGVFDDITIYSDQEISKGMFSTGLLEQISTDNNNTLANYGEWILTSPDKNKVTIPGGDGSELAKESFNQVGEYSLAFNATNRQQRFWGYSSYQRKVIVSDKKKPVVSVSNKLSVNEGEEIELEDLNYDESHEFKFFINDTNIISFENNKISGLKAGVTTMDVWVNDGLSDSDKVSIEITVVPKLKLTLLNENTEINLKINQSLNVTELFNKQDGVTLNVDIIDDGIISLVDSGMISNANNNDIFIKGLKTGSTNITVSASDGSRKSNPVILKVNVSDQVVEDDDKGLFGNLPKAGSALLIIAVMGSALVGSSYLLYRRKLNI